jgi:hypothetical protein
MREGDEATGGGRSPQSGRPPAIQELRTLGDIASHEPALLELVAADRFGAQLFLCDPVRFLRERGWPVNQALAGDLARWRKSEPERGRYERIAQGKDPLCSVDLSLRRLAIPKELG